MDAHGVDEPARSEPVGLVATTAPGLAQEVLIHLLAEDQALREFFGELAHRSGAVHRNALRLEAAAYEREAARGIGFSPAIRQYERFLEQLEPWASEHPLTGGEIEQEIKEHLAGRGLPWSWLARATYGAFTWVVDTLATGSFEILDWQHPTTETPAVPHPADLPELEPWYWNLADRPTVPEDTSFGGIVLYRGDTLEMARNRIRAAVEEVERHLAAIAVPVITPGPRLKKLREATIRDVTWFYRNAVLGISKQVLAREEFGAEEPNAKVRAEIAAARAKDVRDGIARAKRLLAQAPHLQPILTLDEYERGRMRI